MNYSLRSPFTHADVEIISEKDLSCNFLIHRQYKLRHRRYDGTMSGLIERDLCILPSNAVGILLYDPKKHQIAITEQFRAGAFADEVSPWVLEIVMGMRDATNETELACALREAKEEAGANIKRTVPITHYFSSPGTSSEQIQLFCGEVDIETLGGIHGCIDEDEDIRVCILTLQEAKDALENGLINTASTIIALQWLFINKDMLWL